MANTSQVIFLGNRGRGAKVNEFMGHHLFDLRKYFWSEEKAVYFPSKVGICLNREEFNGLKSSMCLLEQEFERLEKSANKAGEMRYHPYQQRNTGKSTDKEQGQTTSQQPSYHPQQVGYPRYAMQLKDGQTEDFSRHGWRGNTSACSTEPQFNEHCYEDISYNIPDEELIACVENIPH